MTSLIERLLDIGVRFCAETQQEANTRRNATCKEAAACIQQLEEALRPFVEGASHTQVFLRSREKMHPVGQKLYAEDVERARKALDNLKPRV